MDNFENKKNLSNSGGGVRINILSPGRFHVLDLSRELVANGFDVKFYSFVPSSRAESFDLSKKFCCSLFIPLAPFVLLERRLFSKSALCHKIRVWVQDLLTSVVMRDSDVVIAMSGNFLHSLKVAKRRGSIVIVERGSKHILEQRRILETISEHGEKPVPDFNVERELKDYELSDYVTIASKHVEQSFVEHAYPKEKIFRNPYGVDLSMFSYMSNVTKEYDVIMVGQFCKRKGCDLLIEALKDTNYTFIHVGNIVDVEFPSLPNFTHVEPVDQKKLIEYYNKAKVFILPSREDGFGMVLSQAMACGLPIVCTKDTGGEDLRDFLPDSNKKFVIILDEATQKDIRDGIERALRIYDELPPNHDYIGTIRNDISWEAYGKRYTKFINSIVNKF